MSKQLIDSPAKVKNKKWIDHFSLIVNFRILNKFHRKKLNELLF